MTIKNIIAAVARAQITPMTIGIITCASGGAVGGLDNMGGDCGGGSGSQGTWTGVVIFELGDRIGCVRLG